MFPRIDKGPIEYTLEVYPAYNSEEQKDCLRFHFRTTEEFNHFKYKIAIEQQYETGKLRFKLKGLQAKGLLPGVGNAETAIDLFDLAGDYDVTIIKPGEIVNDFHFSIGEQGAVLTSEIEGAEQFLEVYIRNESTGKK